MTQPTAVYGTDDSSFWEQEERREAAGDPPATLTPPSIQGWLKECSTQAPPGPSRAAIMLAESRKERREAAGDPPATLTPPSIQGSSLLCYCVKY